MVQHLRSLGGPLTKANVRHSPPTAAPRPEDYERIPVTLQAVFLASNRGKEVYKPPPCKAANKTFLRSLAFWAKRGQAPSTLEPANTVKKGKKKKKKKKAGPLERTRNLFSFGTRNSSGSGKKKKKSKKKKSSNKKDVQAPASDRSDTSNSSSSNPAGSKSSSIAKKKASTSSTSSSTNASSPNRGADSGAFSTLALLSPQALLDAMIRARGYSTKTFNTKDTGYYNKPTDLQRASYDVNLIQIVRRVDKEHFKYIMGSGVSLNPCNSHGESLVHMLARRGDTELLQILVDLGCSLQVADDYGRTPLHDACWTAKPCFDIVDIILKADRRLLHMTDCRGALPLSYIRKCNWNAWLEFLESRKETYWPSRTGDEPDPELTKVPANSCPIPDPRSPLSTELAAMVVSGTMEPDEAQLLMYSCDYSTVSETSGSCYTFQSEEFEDESDDEEEEEEGSEYDSEYGTEYESSRLEDVEECSSEYSDSEDYSDSESSFDDIDESLLAASQLYLQRKQQQLELGLPPQGPLDCQLNAFSTKQLVAEQMARPLRQHSSLPLVNPIRQ